MRTAEAVFFALALCSPWADEQISIYDDQYNWDHPNQAIVNEEELFTAIPNSRFYRASSFFFSGCLDNDYTFIINVFQWDYVFVSSWGIYIQMAGGGGETWVHEGKIPAETVTLDHGRFRLSFANSYIEGSDGSFRIRLFLEDFSCNLMIHGLLPPWKPGDGSVYFTPKRDASMRVQLSSPVASIEGSMTIRDKEIPVNGWCSASRSVTVLPLNALDYRYFGLRIFSPPELFDQSPSFLQLHHYVAAYRKKALAIPMLLVIHDGRWAITSKEYSFTPYDFVQDAAYPCPYPKRMRIRAESGGYSLDGEFVCARVVHVDDFMKSLPAFSSALLSLFYDRPVIFRLLGRFQGLLKTPDGNLEELNLAGLGEYSVFQ